MTVAIPRSRRSSMRISFAAPVGRSRRYPSKAPRGVTASCTNAHSLGVDKYGITNFDFNVAVPNRVESPQPLADPPPPAAHQTKPDPAVHRRRECNRGNVAEIVAGTIFAG